MSAEAEYPLGAECDLVAIFENVTLPAICVPVVQSLLELIPGCEPILDPYRVFGTRELPAFEYSSPFALDSLDEATGRWGGDG